MDLSNCIAKDLLSIRAVFFRPDEPFTWASGIQSPVYCDNRLTLTAPEVRTHVEEGLAALIREYRKMQVTLQMNVMAGQQNDPEEMQRFTALSGLLFAKPEVSQFLLAEMRLQQTMADILKIVTEATGLDIQLPG